MFINDLQDECLLVIFGLINELDDLLNCYKVCSKWSHLIAERTRKVKYLIEHRDYELGLVDTSEPNDTTCHCNIPNYPCDYVYYRTEEPIDGTCLDTLFPNLTIAEFSDKFEEKVKHEDIVTLVKQIKSLKGLIYTDEGDESIFQYCDGLEMLSSNYIDPCITENGANIKQLHLRSYRLDRFEKDAHHFPNLERLFIANNAGNTDCYYDGPILRKLKIVEMFFHLYGRRGIYYGFQFMDSCPNLQSAHIFLNFNRIFVDESLQHKSLQDLVLDFVFTDVIKSVKWKELKRLFIKYPNLKHLALRRNNCLKNEHVEHLVRILPNLVLFDVRGCEKVTQEAANYVQDYCKLYGRSIKFYFNDNHHEILSDWPQLSTKYEVISHDFDFMKHCFLKYWVSLSTFLISSDD